MLGWFQALMPKEEQFFDLFESHAAIVEAGAEALRGLLDGGERVPHFCQIVIDRENDADDITAQVLTKIRRSFITPFDRGDIKDLISSMDDAIDQMNKTAKIITLFEIREFDDQMREMGDLALKAAQLTRQAIPLLSQIGRNHAQLNSITEEIIRLEERSDRIHDQGRKAMFLKYRDGNPMGFIIGSDIYDHLEKIVDRFEDVANEISAIVIDHL